GPDPMRALKAARSIAEHNVNRLGRTAQNDTCFLDIASFERAIPAGAHQVRPAAARANTSLQGSLTSPRWSVMQARRRPPPCLVPAQFCLMSAAHALPTAVALSKTVWHGPERSLKCSLTQALIRPLPGRTPAHCALTSAPHAFTTALCA